MKKITLYSFILITLLAFATSCTTSYDYTSQDFENVIVIEATLTNQLKKQEVKLSRTYKLENKIPEFETGATVTISDNIGNTYGFDEVNKIYISANEFKAFPERTYQLNITTKDGKSYSSSNEKLPTENNLEAIVPTVATHEGKLGVEIRAKSFDPTNTSKFYRYEYDESYKVIAPRWISVEAIAEKFAPQFADPPGQITIKQRTTEAKTCYSNKESNDIIQTSTSNLSEDRVDFSVRFIPSTDYIIANRYSILVKQYIQNLESFTFYQTLKEMGGNGSLLSQNQPGFFTGNIKSDDNPNEKVIGFFDVSAYSEKRIFFNFSDVFPDKPLPEYPYECPYLTEENTKFYTKQYCFPDGEFCKGNTLLNSLFTGSIVYYEGYPKTGLVPSDGSVSLTTYPIQCGDCTSFSSNIKPLFWID